MPLTKSCRIAHCTSNGPFRRELCNKHYKRWQAYGDPKFVKQERGTPAERFWAKVDAEGDCWEWTAFRDRDGYGLFGIAEGRSVRAHRFAWESLIGPIPTSLTVDHRCRNRGCVNPTHLEIVPNVVNVARGYGAAAQNARRDVCIYGHPLSGPNLYVQPDGKRMCRECKSARKAQRNVQAKAERRSRGAVANTEKTHCIHGHPLSGANLYIHPRNGRRACRRCGADSALARYHRRKNAAAA